MANIGPIGILEHIDDPMITVIGDDEASMVGKTWISDCTVTAGGDDDFVRAVAAGKGLHYEGSLAAANDSRIEFASAGLYFTGQEGHSMVEIMVQFDGVSDLAFNFGFNDDIEDGTGLPAELGSGGAWVSNADTFLGFVYDSDYTTDSDLRCFWVDDTNDTSTTIEKLRMRGIQLTAGKWLYLKAEMQDRGSGNGVRATFLAVDHNGRSVEKSFNTSVDRDEQLCYYFGLETRDSTARVIYIKNCNWAQSIPNM